MSDNKATYSVSEQLIGIIKLMRPKQWIKNSFVLAPLLFTGEFLNPEAVQQALLATLLFCLASSATYIINDIHDIEHDRRHPKKSKTRPLATGIVTIPTALLTLGMLYATLIWGVVLLLKRGMGNHSLSHSQSGLYVYTKISTGIGYFYDRHRLRTQSLRRRHGLVGAGFGLDVYYHPQFGALPGCGQTPPRIESDWC